MTSISKTMTVTLLNQMKKNREELEMLSNAVMGGVARMELSGGLRLIHASDGYYRMTGYTREESLEAPFSGSGINLVLPEDLPIVYGAVKDLIEKARPVNITYRIVRRDGSIGWNTAYCAGVQNSKNGSYIDVFFLDISSETNMKIHLAALLDSVPGAVIRAKVGEDICIEYANEEFYRMLGYSHKEFSEAPISNNYLSVVYPKDRPSLLNKSTEIFNEGTQCRPYDYRVLAKDGSMRWMRIHTSRIEKVMVQENMVQCIIIDITEEIWRKQKNKLDEERFRIISEQTRDTVYDWDLESGQIYFSPIFERMFGYAAPQNILISFLFQDDFLHKEDIPIMENLIERVMNGEQYTEGEVRAKRKDGTYFWCRHRITAIFDENSRPVRVIGIITDFDSYYKNTSLLRDKAVRDSLTSLYNRMEAEQQIDKILSESGPGRRHAYLQIDVDHFKQINDSFGHSAGDAALKQIASKITKIFRSFDVTARMGGDEFAVFLLDITGEAAAIKRARQLKEAINSEFCSEDEVHKLSVSIGISIFPEHGQSFNELYQCADESLYHAKRAGGNNYWIFSN